jgi:soluble lytic murein transglycosylase-like protein
LFIIGFVVLNFDTIAYTSLPVQDKEDFLLEQEFTKRMKLVSALREFNTQLDYSMANYISFVVLKECTKKDLRPELILGLIQTESDFDHSAIERKGGTYGLMQVRFDTWKDKHRIKNTNQLQQITKNIELGTSILRQYIDSEGSLAKALYRYNTGKSPQPNADWTYPRKVMSTAYRYLLAMESY